MSTDAIVLLKEDHKHIQTLFQQFQDAGPNAVKTKAKIVDKILEALTVHTYIENECMPSLSPLPEPAEPPEPLLLLHAVVVAITALRVAMM